MGDLMGQIHLYADGRLMGDPSVIHERPMGDPLAIHERAL